MIQLLLIAWSSVQLLAFGDVVMVCVMVMGDGEDGEPL